MAETVYMVWRSDCRDHWMLDGTKSSFEAALIAANRIMRYVCESDNGIPRKWKLRQELFPPIAGGVPCTVIAGWELLEITEGDWYRTAYIAIVQMVVEHDVLEVLAFNG